MSFEQAAVRLAGGFARPIDDESLRAAIQASSASHPIGRAGEHQGSSRNDRRCGRHAPQGLARGHRSYRARRRASPSGRYRAPGNGSPDAAAAGRDAPDRLVAAATQRLGHAQAVLGPVEIVGITELSPCWRPLLQALTHHTAVSWTAGPRPTPSWLEATGVTVTRSDPRRRRFVRVSAATAYHEAIEAVRWARSLLASGTAEAADIAIAAASSAEYDDHFLALRADANLDLHFVHGIKVTATRDGQAAAALADILIRGFSQTRMRRLAALCGSERGPLHTLPVGWMHLLPADAPLASLSAWRRLLDRLTTADWPDEQDHTPTLRAIVDLLAKGHAAADEIGTAFLSGRALAIWRKALLAGPSGSLDTTLETLKQDDGLEACVSVAWMPASALAASPRRFVRLIGMNSSRWPRGISEDRLISDHIIPTAELDPLPVGAADRRDFETILATTERVVLVSRPQGQRGTPARAQFAARRASRGNVPPPQRYSAHAFSETDRLMARPTNFDR